ncbi:MAG: LPXTG cell wall anchor domain-containing protein [Solirubrobacterales bacterium]|nr:LPXTG cell wall anchor domain-containing protein [Solirubrobacterales bacterium]
MPLLSRLVVAFAALALSLPGAAFGQTSTIPQDGGGVSKEPPVQLGSGTSEAQTGGAKPDPNGLPNTGSDPRPLSLAGAALMLFGVGLRLRTADAELY